MKLKWHMTITKIIVYIRIHLNCIMQLLKVSNEVKIDMEIGSEKLCAILSIGGGLPQFCLHFLLLCQILLICLFDLSLPKKLWSTTLFITKLSIKNIVKVPALRKFQMLFPPHQCWLYLIACQGFQIVDFSVLLSNVQGVCLETLNRLGQMAQC